MRLVVVLAPKETTAVACTRTSRWAMLETVPCAPSRHEAVNACCYARRCPSTSTWLGSTAPRGRRRRRRRRRCGRSSEMCRGSWRWVGAGRGALRHPLLRFLCKGTACGACVKVSIVQVAVYMASWRWARGHWACEGAPHPGCRLHGSPILQPYAMQMRRNAWGSSSSGAAGHYVA